MKSYEEMCEEFGNTVEPSAKNRLSDGKRTCGKWTFYKSNIVFKYQGTRYKNDWYECDPERIGLNRWLYHLYQTKVRGGMEAAMDYQDLQDLTALWLTHVGNRGKWSDK